MTERDVINIASNEIGHQSRYLGACVEELSLHAHHTRTFTLSQV